MLSLVVFLS